MSRVWYGSVQNRLEEDRMYCDEIKVGTGVTEYSWSDRHPYEVVAVKDQKHVSVRQMGHRHVGDGCMDNSWELFSDESKPIQQLERRGQYWYWTLTVTAEDLKGRESDIYFCLFLANNGFDRDVILAKGKQTKRRRAKVSFGVAEYYYDYEF